MSDWCKPATMLASLTNQMPAQVRAAELVPSADASSFVVNLHLTLDCVKPEERHWEGARAIAHQFGLDPRRIDWVLTGGEATTRAYGYFSLRRFEDDGN